MAKTKKAPIYFVNIIKEADDEFENGLHGIGLSLSWVNQNQGKSFDDILSGFDEAKQKEIKACIKFRSVSYEYAWTKFRLKNINNEWGMAETLDYVPDKKMIKMSDGLMKTLEKFANKIKTKFNGIDITFGPTKK